MEGRIRGRIPLLVLMGPVPSRLLSSSVFSDEEGPWQRTKEGNYWAEDTCSAGGKDRPRAQFVSAVSAAQVGAALSAVP